MEGLEKSDTMKRTGEDAGPSNLSVEEPSERELGSRSHTFRTFSAGGGGVDGGGGDAGGGRACSNFSDHLLCQRDC